MASNTYLEPDSRGGLRWGKLVKGILIKRHKRFLAEVRLDSGEEITAHTPNTGSMLGCSEPGRAVWLSHHESATRKYPYTLEMIRMPGALVGVNTNVPNKLVAQAVRHGGIPELPNPAIIKTEVPYGNSRLDLLVSSANQPDTLIEIKNCTLVENGAAFFPDAVTERGAKHLSELSSLSREGKRAIIFILVQRADADCFRPADHIDPEWGRILRQVLNDGVELLVYQAALDIRCIALNKRLPVIL